VLTWTGIKWSTHFTGRRKKNHICIQVCALFRYKCLHYFSQFPVSLTSLQFQILILYLFIKKSLNCLICLTTFSAQHQNYNGYFSSTLYWKQVLFCPIFSSKIKPHKRRLKFFTLWLYSSPSDKVKEGYKHSLWKFDIPQFSLQSTFKVSIFFL